MRGLCISAVVSILVSCSAPSAEVAPPPVAPPAPAPLTACGPPPPPPAATIAPTCTTVALASMPAQHHQLTLQLASGATTRIDCPRMRYRGQDTPVCVVKEVAGRLRGACCPPGRVDPTDPECVAEGTIDEMYARQRAWEWCKKDAPPTRPCEPCVWYPNAER
ncbi:MAG: hypothetical protein KIT84_20535 [Labilithrix sp.]|nr:hypothetical protein [Labilithrix sp.]MCW5813428.1 hypothetical protein [Labilithrix sp.]